MSNRKINRHSTWKIYSTLQYIVHLVHRQKSNKEIQFTPHSRRSSDLLATHTAYSETSYLVSRLIENHSLLIAYRILRPYLAFYHRLSRLDRACLDLCSHFAFRARAPRFIVASRVLIAFTYFTAFISRIHITHPKSTLIKGRVTYPLAPSVRNPAVLY